MKYCPAPEAWPAQRARSASPSSPCQVSATRDRRGARRRRIGRRGSKCRRYQGLRRSQTSAGLCLPGRRELLTLGSVRMEPRGSRRAPRSVAKRRSREQRPSWNSRSGSTAGPLPAAQEPPAGARTVGGALRRHHRKARQRQPGTGGRAVHVHAAGLWQLPLVSADAQRKARPARARPFNVEPQDEPRAGAVAPVPAGDAARDSGRRVGEPNSCASSNSSLRC